MKSVKFLLLFVAAAVIAACGDNGNSGAPPVTPINVNASAGDSMVSISWEAVSGADSYNIYWLNARGVSKTNGTKIQSSARILDHTGLTNSMTYYYVVSAINSHGESEESIEVSATPAPSQFPLTISKAGSGGGTVTSNPTGISCGRLFCRLLCRHNCYVDRHAGFCRPYRLVRGMLGGTCSVTIDAAKSATATFTKVTHILTVANSGGGTVTSNPAGISCGSTCSAAYTAGTTVTLTATPDATSTFIGWLGACSGTGMCAVTMDAAKAAAARFTYTLTVARAGTGSGLITSAPAGISCGSTCSANYDVSTAVTLTATPDASSTFIGWSGGVCTGSTSCTVTMDAAKAVTGNFILL
jgi:hypothetical protein